MKRIVLFIILLVFFNGCNYNEKKNEKLAQDFFSIYSSGKDMSSLQNFYAENAEWEDIILGEIQPAKKIVFNNEYFSYVRDTVNYPNILQIDEFISKDSVIIVNGSFNPAYYKNINTQDSIFLDKAEFSICLYFNKDHKIVKQKNWIQYSLENINEALNLKKSLQIFIGQ